MHLYLPGWDESLDPLVWAVFGYQPFTHAYVPQDHFDQVVQDGHWTVAEHAGAYIALWSWRAPSFRTYDPAVHATRDMVLPFDLVADGGPDNVWIVEVGTSDDDGDLDAFVASLGASEPEVVRDDEGFAVTWTSPSAGTVQFSTTGPFVVDGDEQPLGGFARHESPWGTVEHLRHPLRARRRDLDLGRRRRRLDPGGVVSDGAPGRFAVVGADHLHLFSLVAGLLRAGARPVAHTAGGDLLGGYESWQADSERRDLGGVLDDVDIDLVVVAGVPSERAAVAVAALESGKAVLSDKPGVTTRGQLESVRAAIAGCQGRPWTVLFSERFENRAVTRAMALAVGGAVGQVVHVAGAAPHSMHADQRPPWFWDPARSGGILVDIGSHQVDQFLGVTGDPASVQVGGSPSGTSPVPRTPTCRTRAP